MNATKKVGCGGEIRYEAQYNIPICNLADLQGRGKRNNGLRNLGPDAVIESPKTVSSRQFL